MKQLYNVQHVFRASAFEKDNLFWNNEIIINSFILNLPLSSSANSKVINRLEK